MLRFWIGARLQLINESCECVEARLLDAFDFPSEVRMGEEPLDGLCEALAHLKSILKDHGLIGGVEPLGSEECSLRLEAEAIASIDAVGGAKRLRVTHDTFHHFEAGERVVFADRTGLIPVCGITNTKYTVATMRDAQRELIDANDVIDYRGQVKRVIDNGYKGYVSFQSFSAEVHKDIAIARSIARSMDYLEG